MERSYNLSYNISDAVITPTNNRLPPYQAVTDIELSISERWHNEYRLHITLEDEQLDALYAKPMGPVKLEYRYELITGSDGDVVSSGKVHRCTSAELTSRRRVVRLHNSHITITELIHEAIGSMMLSNMVEYNDRSIEVAFFNAASNITPYTAGFGKTGPIDSVRFWMSVPSNIEGLCGRRRFVSEVQSDGSRLITGMYTNWTYGELVTEQPKVLFTNQARFDKEEEPKLELPQCPKPARTFKPMTDVEVFEQFKKITFPVIE